MNSLLEALPIELIEHIVTFLKFRKEERARPRSDVETSLSNSTETDSAAEGAQEGTELETACPHHQSHLRLTQKAAPARFHKS
jgi:hypothetical protein